MTITTSPPQAVAVARRGKLLQVLGVSFGVAVLIGNTILIGILRTPGDVAARLPESGALHRRLDHRRSLRPARRHLPGRAGRDGRPSPAASTSFVRRGLGEYPGFVVGWSDWISTCAPVALGGMVFTEYLEPLVPALAGRRVLGGRRPWCSSSACCSGAASGSATSRSRS